jgi:hypothetical protein
VRLLGIGVQVPSEPGAALAAVAQAERLLADSTRVCDPCSIDFRLQAASASARGGDLSGPAAVWEARARIRLAEGEPSLAAAFLREAADGFARAQRPVDEARCRAAANVL